MITSGNTIEAVKFVSNSTIRILYARWNCDGVNAHCRCSIRIKCFMSLKSKHDHKTFRKFAEFQDWELRLMMRNDDEIISRTMWEQVMFWYFNILLSCKILPLPIPREAYYNDYSGVKSVCANSRKPSFISISNINQIDSWGWKSNRNIRTNGHTRHIKIFVILIFGFFHHQVFPNARKRIFFVAHN